MEQYLGVKQIKAKPITLGEYNELRGWAIPADENPAKEGYLVEYEPDGKPNHKDFEGYISWSPKEVFDKAYRKTTGLTFGLAVEAAKRGEAISRIGWNGQNMFAYIVPANSYPPSTQVMKDYFKGENVPYRAYWALKTAQEDVATWTPSGSDTLAEDWYILT